jgi:hypothetical protein
LFRQVGKRELAIRTTEKKRTKSFRIKALNQQGLLNILEQKSSQKISGYKNSVNTQTDIITINSRCLKCQSLLKIEKCSDEEFRWTILFCPNWCFEKRSGKKKIDLNVIRPFADYYHLGNRIFLQNETTRRNNKNERVFGFIKKHLNQRGNDSEH